MPSAPCALRWCPVCLCVLVFLFAALALRRVPCAAPARAPPYPPPSAAPRALCLLGGVVGGALGWGCVVWGVVWVCLWWWGVVWVGCGGGYWGWGLCGGVGVGSVSSCHRLLVLTLKMGVVGWGLVV